MTCCTSKFEKKGHSLQSNVEEGNLQLMAGYFHYNR